MVVLVVRGKERMVDSHISRHHHRALGATSPTTSQLVMDCNPLSAAVTRELVPVLVLVLVRTTSQLVMDCNPLSAAVTQTKRRQCMLVLVSVLVYMLVLVLVRVVLMLMLMRMLMLDPQN
jgi:hypothetical protein